MRIRTKLVVMLSGFAVFAVLAASATIYAVHWRIESAVQSFERTIGDIVRVKQLQLSINEQLFYLRGVIDGDADAVRAYLASRDECLTRLRQIARYAHGSGEVGRSEELLTLTRSLEESTDECLRLVQAGDRKGALALVTGKIHGEIALAIVAHLHETARHLEDDRSAAARKLGATSKHVLSLTLTVGALGVLMVLIGAMLIRGWLISPMRSLAVAAEHYRDGEFAYRVRAGADDELGQLGDALNDMAHSVSEAQASLQASETKYRSLFRNLRDAVVICDLESRVVEFHEGDAKTLGVEGDEHIDRPLLEVWPEWASATPDWPGVITSAIVHGRRFRATDVAVAGKDRSDNEIVLDFLVYRIEVGQNRFAAIVVRDVSDRHRLQRKLRQAETMEAVGTLAGGLAHDFNNLLASVTGSLSMLVSEVGNAAHAERIRTVLKTCWQASALSRKLLNFATSAHGNPQVFALSETVETMLGSFDPSFFEGVTFEKDLDSDVIVRMDQDQFTQVVLNLLRNARDAMPEGGTLSISVKQTTERHPDAPSDEERFGMLVVKDTGTGMTPDVQRRIFEPLFTTKSRASGRGRGLGLAVAYSAVKNAGGFIKIESEPGRGTTFRIYLPLGESPLHPVLPSDDAGRRNAKDVAALFVDNDPLVVQTWVDAIQQWGYEVATGDSVDEAHIAASQTVHPLRVAVIDVEFDNDRGLAFAEMLTREAPDLRVILTTGAAKRDIPAPIADVVIAQLSKPFALDTFRTAIDEAAKAGLPAKRNLESNPPTP